MPFVRVTLVNDTNHKAHAEIRVQPGGKVHAVDAAAHDSAVKNLLPEPVQTITANSSVEILGVPSAKVRPAADLGGHPGDDITEAVVHVGLAVGPEKICAEIVNGGAVRWDEQPLN